MIRRRREFDGDLSGVKPEENFAYSASDLQAQKSIGEFSDPVAFTAAYRPNTMDEAPIPAPQPPMVFALRAYPDMYVYEYADRLEYYRRTDRGMELNNIETKKKV